MNRLSKNQTLLSPKGTFTLGRLLGKIITPICHKQGLMKADLILEWPRIIGEDLGKACHVLKITFPFKSRQEGCLHLQTSGSMAAVLPYSEPLIIQRINQYYGYPAIGKIRIFHKNVPFADGPQHHKITSHGPLPSSWQSLIQTLPHEPLKQALKGLAHHIHEKD